MLQQFISYISTLDPALIYVVLFAFSFIENVVPPSPSDLVVVIGATLIVHSPIGFIPVLLITTFGSALGFVVMYYVGKYLGDTLVRKGRLKFIKAESLEKADLWFNKYGYKLILINRFMPGTRAVISFFSGVHRLKPLETFFYAGISSFFWNIILICLGIFLGDNIVMIDHYLKTYSNVILVLTILAVGFLLIKFIWRKKTNR